MLIIPAIDIIDGKVVRLRKGDFNEVSNYKVTPFEQAKKYFKSGFKWIHLVDLNASKTGSISTIEIIKKIKEETQLKIEFGGGVRNAKTVEELVNAGVERVVVGSLSVTDRKVFEEIVKTFGADEIVVAADVKNENIAIKGWTENSDINLFKHIEYCISLGLEYFLCTDISRDGMMTGPNINLYKKIIDRYPNIKLIASGGIKDINDIIALKSIKINAVIVGKAIYENKVSLKELIKIGK
jgi:phosphoribosylformimino-5-aminoimidazole carboxamide ribotide isomerase